MKKSIALVLLVPIIINWVNIAYAANSQYYKQVLQDNIQQRNAEVDPNYYLEIDDEEFKQLSDRIVGSIKNDYDKVKAIHDWVCENIYYDFDAYENDLGAFVARDEAEIYRRINMSAYEKLMTYKRGLCSYYSAIFSMLVRAQDIPCMTVSGYAENSSVATETFDGYLIDQTAQKVYITGDKWTAQNMERTRSNHAWNEVYVNGRWIIVDTTWDSQNTYRKQKYTSASHTNTYFDISIEAFSKDHRIMEYGKDASDFTKNIDFQDVTVNDYFYEPVHWAVNGGIVAPTGKDTFSPYDICNQASVIFTIWQMLDEPAASQEKYYNAIAKATTWETFIIWAHEQGLITDEEDCALNDSCTRGQLVRFLWCAVGSPEVSEPVHFIDVAPDADYAKAVSWAVSQGITSGTSATTFSPDAICTRGQMVTFLYKMCQTVA